jgi:hypothetical protein
MVVFALNGLFNHLSTMWLQYQMKQLFNFNKKEGSLKQNKTWFPALKNRKIGNQLGIAKGRISTNQSPDRTTANETPGRHSSRQVPGTVSTHEKANLHHFRNDN